MSFFMKIFGSWLQDAAVTKLASSKSFQNFAVKTVETQEVLQKAAQRAAENPEAAKKALSEGIGSFFAALKKEIQKDVSRMK